MCISKMIESYQRQLTELAYKRDNPPICQEYVDQDGNSMQSNELRAYFTGAYNALYNVLEDLKNNKE